MLKSIRIFNDSKPGYTMNYRLAPIACVFFILAMLSGCEKPADTVQAEARPAPAVAEPVPAEKVEKAEIDWFDGSVDEAFALARAENKPIFLYWGAVWCPPCVEIKHTVFNNQQFIEQSRLFVPVYLDGDTERAQIYGDKFVTKVYPTLIVFNPEGEEVTRLHAGMEISTYRTVLELSLDSMRPTSDLVKTALDDAATLNDAELQQLAYYSWYDNEKVLPEGTSPELFNTLASVSADRNPKASARFYLQYLVMISSSEEAGVKADPAQLKAILESPELLFATWDYLTSYPEQLVSAVEAGETELASLREELVSTVLENRHSDLLPTTKQMSAWNTYLSLREGDDEVPESVIADIRADGAAADEKTSGKSARLSVINVVYGTYMDAGLIEDARTLLTAEIEKSKTPYYFMSALAYLEEQEGNVPEAIEWRRKAYEASTGPATRIRWWARYVQAVVRMAPGNSEAIQQASLAIFGDSQVLGDAFVGANFRNLQKTAEALQEWDAEYHPDQSMLDDFNARMEGLCEAQTADSPELASCTSLLGSETG